MYIDQSRTHRHLVASAYARLNNNGKQRKMVKKKKKNKNMDGLATERSARYSDAMPNSVSLYLDFFHSYCSVSDTMFILYFIAPYFFSSRARNIQTYQTTFLFSAFSFFHLLVILKTFFHLLFILF